MRARRSWSQTDVRSAPNRRFAPMQNISSPADSVVDETSRENVCSSSRSSICRSTSPARVRAIERERERVADRRGLAQLLAARAASRSR